MNLARCLSFSACMLALFLSRPTPMALAGEDDGQWALVAGPALHNPNPPAPSTKPKREASDAGLTTQSVSQRTQSKNEVQALVAGWNLTSTAGNAQLAYFSGLKPQSKKSVPSAAAATPVGFSCRRGDGFAIFRGPAISGYAAGKRVAVQLKSAAGTIRIESKVLAETPKVIQSEATVMTSSLVFVLSPKKGDVKATVGGWSGALETGPSAVELAHFQSLCDQPRASESEE
jgi:hypothetical protein